jgi:site-specific DNA-methyltransferase (adenine-specific)/adenine-specific DNA-methyltransferase
MPKAQPPAYELSDAEKRDLTELIRTGQPLPEKYRFLLFADKREVELVWNGKTRDACTTVLPFQTLEHVDEPRKETKTQFEMFDARGRQTQGWTNKLIWGDNKLILSSLKAGALRRQIEDAGGLKLIYIDPPFDVGADFSMDIEIGGETFHKEPNLLEQIAYRDTWGRGADSFISMIYERLILMRDLLADDGSIYVHCDWRVNAHMREALDEVFGAERFDSEIIWRATNTHPNNKTYGNVHQSIYFYHRGESFVFNTQYGEYDEDYIETYYNRICDKTGKRFQSADLVGHKGVNPIYEWHGISRPWRFPKHRLDELDAEGRIFWTNNGFPRLKRYLDDARGMPASSLWVGKETRNIRSWDAEAQGYSTQKPEALLERIVKASSNQGDLVADFFCGSGTTAAVAERLGRKWIATDLGKFAIHTTRKRLIGVQRELKAADRNFRAFEVLNLGRYERQAYLNVGGRLSPEQREAALQAKEREFRELILRAYKGEALPNDGFFDGRLGARLVVIGPINLPVGRLFVEEVITECRKRGATRCDVLAFEFEMGLFPAVLEEAKAKGIDLTPKYIPAEVFDKRAVDKGQVVFHDISFVEATPRYAKGKSAKQKLTLQIELTDFSVYYTQGAAEAAIANLKDGKNGVICEQGRLIKISKDRNGVVSKEILTKDWTDWVDYWAVDFDYESRKEIIKVPVGFDLPSPAGRGVGGEGSALPGRSNESVPSPGAARHPRPAGEGSKSDAALPEGEGKEPEFEEHWTGSYIFENEWQSFRTRKQRDLELITAEHTYDRPGRYIVAVKVIDIFGNDTMTLVPVNVG